MNAIEIIIDSLRTGALTTAATTAAVAACGEAEEGNPLPALNAVSHILWGDKAAAKEGASAKYTLTGLALNAAAVGGWAGVYHLMFGRSHRGRPGAALAGGALVSALACFADYVVVPERFTPGFEKRLSGTSLLAIYSALALALAAGGATDGRH